MFSLIVLNAINAIGFPIGKLLLQYNPPLLVTGCRLAISGIILLIAYYIVARSSFLIHKKAWLLFFNLSFLSMFLSFSLGMWSLHYVSVSKASFLYNLSPFITALFSYYYFSEKITMKKWLGLLIGFVGFVPILLTNNPITNGQAGVTVSAGFWLLSIGEIAVIISVITYCYGWIITRLLMQQGYHVLFINGVSMFCGGIFSLIGSTIIERPQTVTWNPYTMTLLSIIIMSGITAYILYSSLLRVYTATFLSFAAFTMPFFAAVYGWFITGETISWAYIASTVAVFVGLYIFYQEELKQGYIQKI